MSVIVPREVSAPRTAPNLQADSSSAATPSGPSTKHTDRREKRDSVGTFSGLPTPPTTVYTGCKTLLRNNNMIKGISFSSGVRAWSVFGWISIIFFTWTISSADCLENLTSSANDSHATCWFSGVYPSGSVHWFQGDVNLTDSTSPQTEMDQQGRFNVLSTVAVQKGNPREPYNCSLWIPSDGKYLSSELVYRVRTQNSSGSIVKLQWISVMVEIVMLKFMT
ncbi:hypothetical protein L3Q82_014353 [Scortum barcoo]|uniref:Uncharacterized protein n=1 Tax=Scortum barcoo TaxID=214431 RepID=A0ACB8VWR0_9TELE|nr:hypothetical protein L3Q82_014353 [Scortum barcoo]